jgi:TonB-linked SusC/RagA family outer membrane protein
MKKNVSFNKTLVKIMQVGFVQLLLTVLFVGNTFAGGLKAQAVLEKKVSLQLQNKEIRTVLEEIRKQSNVDFVFSREVIEADRRISIAAKNEALGKLLGKMLQPLSLNYQVVGSLIIITRAEMVVETFPIKGKVLSNRGDALPGASLLLKGTTRGVVTNADGEFTMDGLKEGTYKLIVSYVGHATKEVQVTVPQRDAVSILLQEEMSALDEVVVVGYGSQIKKELTGSIETVSNKELKDIPVAQVTQKLQGKLAGVQINQATGKPGQGMSIRIRGQASILAGSDPLYVVDGFPIVGDISGVNPDEIENISVLKDAASTSLYGSRAANGVVLITTKQAKKNQTNVSFNAYTGWQTVPQKGRPALMNAEEFAQFQKESYEDKGLSVPALFQNPAQYAGKSTDWYGALLRTAPMQSYNLTLTSNKDKLSTSVVAGIFNQDGVMINSNFKRYSLRVNTEYALSDKVKLGFNLAPSYSINNTPSSDGIFWATNVNQAVPGGLFTNAMLAWPTSTYQNADGSLPLEIMGGFPTPNWYRSAQEITSETKTSRIISNANVQYTPIRNLVIKSTFNVDLGSSAFAHFSPSTASTAFWTSLPTTASAMNMDTKYTSWLNENTATYTKKFGEHNLELLVGYTNQRYRAEVSQIRATNFPDDRIHTIQSALNIDRTNTYNDVQEWSLTSYLSRVNYSFKGKYLLTAAVRRDGSSRFGTDNRWGNFPSVGLGWVVSDEPFMKAIEPISFAKFRASYGVIGNNNIGNYTQYALINNASNAVFGSTIASGASVSSLGNSKLGWETTKQLDLGFDIAFLNDRISFTYDFYTKNTNNLLYNVAVAQESGFTNFNDNVGEIKFWGHEFSVNSKNLVGNFKWNTNLNVSFNRNEVVALADGVERIYGGNGNFQTITQVGKPLGQFYGLIQEGVYKNAADFNSSPKAVDSQVGTIKYKDVNGDGKITFGGDNDDRAVIGNPFPTAIFGITNTFNYKNIDLSIVGSGSFGNDLMVLTEQGTTNLDGVFNVLANVKNRWRSEANPGDGLYGKTTAATYMERDWSSSRFVSNGAYFTIKNITLGYTIPTSGKYFKSARVYGSVQQAFVFTNYRGVNPEASTSFNGTSGSTLNLGMDYGTYPVPRTITVGFNIGF